mmetsp:Transcript_51738/g.97031  ORF Transcript_51738/g.97031 Transcript_51738/m.97031 type:complete len:352 (+) Transcript_51738:93-1148(+)
MAISRLFSRKSTKSHSNVVPQDAKHSLYGPESNNVSGRLSTPNRPPKNNKERLEFAQIEAQNNQYTLMEVKNSLAKSLNQREAKKVRPVELQRGWTMAKQDADARREQTARLQAAVDKAKSDRLVVVEEMQVSDKAGEAERQESALLREKIRRLLEKRDAFQMAKKETKAAEREPSFEASRTNPLSVGRRIKTHGLVNNADLNEVKGTLLEEVRNNVWKVRFDQDLGEHLLKEANMKTLVGGMVSNSEKAGQSKAIDAEVHPFCIAGTFNDWVPQDMRWDVVLGCFAHEVELDKDDIGKFGISQGIATGVRWKTRPVKQWTIGRKGGRYQIRLYVKDDRCSPSKIEWAELK